MIDYKEYQHLLFERRPNGVLLITLNRPEVLNATNDRLHWELTQIWLTIDRDKDTRVAVVTGAGRAFSAGGDMDMVERNATDPRRLANTVREASDIVYNMINLDKPVISAINGVAVGAGLVVAMMADISDGKEAERIGLVSLCVPAAELLPKAFEVADKLAQGSQQAIRWTKKSLNNWLRMAGPIFDQSIALEMLTFMEEDVREGIKAIREKRPPRFPSAR